MSLLNHPSFSFFKILLKSNYISSFKRFRGTILVQHFCKNCLGNSLRMEKTQILFRVAQKWHFPTDILTQLACKRKKTHSLRVLFLLNILYRVENNHNRAGNYCNIFGLPTAKTASLRNAFWFLSLHCLQFLSFQTFFHKPGVLSKKKCLKNILLFYTHLSAKILTFLIFFSFAFCDKFATNWQK